MVSTLKFMEASYLRFFLTDGNRKAALERDGNRAIEAWTFDTCCTDRDLIWGDDIAAA